LLAERRIGELLKATERAKGTKAGGGPGRGKRGPMREPRFWDDAPRLAELGISKKESSRAQELAELPDDKFKAVAEGHRLPTLNR